MQKYSCKAAEEQKRLQIYGYLKKTAFGFDLLGFDD